MTIVDVIWVTGNTIKLILLFLFKTVWKQKSATSARVIPETFLHLSFAIASSLHRSPLLLETLRSLFTVLSTSTHSAYVHLVCGLAALDTTRVYVRQVRTYVTQH